MAYQSLAVVIRSSGERTFDTLYRQILSSSIDLNLVSAVSSECFEKTLTFSYEKALEMNKRWTLIIDADILLGYNLFNLINKATKVLNENDLGFAFRVFDKFYNAPKFRGLHVYQTKHLEKALNFIPAIGETLRPETFVKERMKIDGNHHWRGYKNTLGLHDFYQSPYDIFCKMAIRAHRSKKDVEQLLTYYDIKSKEGDSDFVFAKEGLIAGALRDENEIDNSRIKYKNDFENLFGKIPSRSLDLQMNDWAINKVLIKSIFTHGFGALVKNFNRLH